MLTKGQIKKKLMGYTNKELARKVDISESYLVNILSGKIKPSKQTLERLAQALELDPDDVQKPISRKLIEDLSDKLNDSNGKE